MTAFPPPSRKPRDDEIDAYGLTHVGKVRKNNQDQFLLATINRRVQVLATSLTPQQVPLSDDRLAYVVMVADGVGGLTGGQEASSTALGAALQYVTDTMECYHRADTTGEHFIAELQATALRAHQAVREKAKLVEGRMATTLTLYMGVWPTYYLLQVGDSRYYLFRQGVLTQISRDQTMAQELVDRGVMSRDQAEGTRLANILSSSIGGDESQPVVTRLNSEWGNAHLMCSDGLIKHVTDARIAEVLSTMTSAKQAAEQLLQDALDGGGTDNITVVIGRTVPRDIESTAVPRSGE